MITFIWYPKCSTCKKAKNWLDQHNIIYQERDIVKNCPTKEELNSWYRQNSYLLKRYFNTSGNLYKEMNLKDQLEHMSEESQLDLLSSNGMLIRRPIIVMDNKVLIGFKESEWKEFFKL